MKPMSIFNLLFAALAFISLSCGSQHGKGPAAPAPDAAVAPSASGGQPPLEPAARERCLNEQQLSLNVMGWTAEDGIERLLDLLLGEGNQASTLPRCS